MEQQIRLDEGYLFGLGAFETIAVWKNRGILLQSHLERLERALKFLGIEKKVGQKEVENWIKLHPMENGVLKLVVSGKNTFISRRENQYTEKQYKAGFTVGISAVRRNETSPFTYYKTLNYGDNIREKRLAGQAGYDEPVFLNSQGQITEGAVSNIFFVEEKRVVTPAVSCGLLPGIMRRYVLENYEVEERKIYPEDIERFEECFLTNSLMGVMPVRWFEGTEYKNRSVCDQIYGRYREEMFD